MRSDGLDLKRLERVSVDGRGLVPPKRYSLEPIIQQHCRRRLLGLLPSAYTTDHSLVTAHTHARTHACTHVHTHKHTHTHTHTHTNTHTHKYTHTHTHTKQKEINKHILVPYHMCINRYPPKHSMSAEFSPLNRTCAKQILHELQQTNS